MTDKLEKQAGVAIQPTYDPPQALRMGDIRAGAGGTPCAQPGSGDVGYCSAGSGAQGDGCDPGNAASVCTGPGNDAEIN
jgi:hypothetical protein